MFRVIGVACVHGRPRSTKHFIELDRVSVYCTISVAQVVERAKAASAQCLRYPRVRPVMGACKPLSARVTQAALHVGHLAPGHTLESVERA